MRSQLLRLKVDILCMQEVNRQEEEGEPSSLLALGRLIEGKPYADYHSILRLLQEQRRVFQEGLAQIRALIRLFLEKPGAKTVEKSQDFAGLFI